MVSIPTFLRNFHFPHMPRPMCLFVGLSLLFVSVQAAFANWVVIGTIGQWSYTQPSFDHKRPVEFGLSLTVGDRLIREGNDRKTGSITLLAGSTHVTYACDDQNSLPDKSNVGCLEPLMIPSAPPGQIDGVDSPLTILFNEIGDLLHKRPAAYYRAASRDYGDLEDAVVELRAPSLDLTPALIGLSKGEYRFTIHLMHVPGDGVPLGQATFSLSWNPESKSGLVNAQPSPGLYSLKAVSADGAAIDEAWILVATPAQFPTKSDAFAKLKALTSAWKDDAPAGAIRAVQRAALDGLAR